MRLTIHHRTRYTYSAPVAQSFNELRLHPPSDASQTCTAFDLAIEPRTPFRRRLDFYSNWVHAFEVNTPHAELLVETRSAVTTHPQSPPLASCRAPLARPGRADQDAHGLHEFLGDSPCVPLDPETWRLALDFTAGAEDAAAAAAALGRALRAGFRYLPASTDVRSSSSDFFRDRRGVCQDFAHGMIALCRSLGIAARYASGYLYTGPGEGPEPTAGEASHAWCELFFPGAGWIGYDPTHGIQAGERHVRLAVGRDYSDVPPFKGSYRGNAGAALRVEVAVREAG